MKANLFLLLFLLSFIGIKAQDNPDAACMKDKTDQLVQLFRGKPSNWYFQGNADSGKDWFRQCHADVFSILDDLYLDNNQEIHIDLPKELGGHSSLYLQEGVNVDADQLMKSVCLKTLSPASCWQWVLLNHVLHLFPHGVRYTSQIRFANSDKEWSAILDNLKGCVVPDSVQEVECGAIPESKYASMRKYKIQLAPLVLIDRAQGMVFVRFYAWSDWQGLTERNMFLKIKDNVKLELLKYDRKVIFDYITGIF